METGTHGNQSLLVNLTQTGQSVAGAWSAANGWEGRISGVIEQNTFAGEATFTGSSVNRVECDGQGTFRGSASSDALSWASTGFTGSCSGLPANLRFVLQRR